jgi:hypothetical protein
MQQTSYVKRTFTGGPKSIVIGSQNGVKETKPLMLVLLK